jgi:hypothetical protein
MVFTASERYGEKKNILLMPGIELRPFGRPACSQSLYGGVLVKRLSEQKISMFYLLLINDARSMKTIQHQLVGLIN